MFGVESVRKLLLNLIATTDEVMKELQTALDNGNRDGIEAIAHKLVGSCGTLRAWDLHAQSKELNAVADTEQWAALSERCNNIKTAYARLKNESLAFVEKVH